MDDNQFGKILRAFLDSRIDVKKMMAVSDNLELNKMYKLERKTHYL